MMRCFPASGGPKLRHDRLAGVMFGAGGHRVWEGDHEPTVGVFLISLWCMVLLSASTITRGEQDKKPMRTSKLQQGAEECLRKHGIKLVLAGALRFPRLPAMPSSSSQGLGGSCTAGVGLNEGLIARVDRVTGSQS